MGEWLRRDAFYNYYFLISSYYLATPSLRKRKWITDLSDFSLSLQKKAIRLNNQGKTMIAKDSFVPLLQKRRIGPSER